MTLQMPISSAPPVRHARLFELIRQNNLAVLRAQADKAKQQQTTGVTPRGAQHFAKQAKRSLLPQEQAALGISQSFGR